MNGFSWVRVDRAIDHSAPLKLLARAMGKDDIWALGLYVRLRLITAGRFPTGHITMPAAHLELELDAPEGTVDALLSCGLLEAVDDGFQVPGWQDDPAVREVLNKRLRAGGRQTDGSLSQGVGQAVAGLSQGVPQPVAGGTAATPQAVTGGSASLSQAVTGGSSTDMTHMTDRTHSTDMKTPLPPKGEMGQGKPDLLPVAYGEGAAIVLDAWPPEKRCNPRAVVMAIRQDGMQPDAHTCARIADAARAWVAAYSQQGRAQYLPRLDNWISAGSWREAPPDAPAPSQRRARTKNGEVALTSDDMAFIVQQARELEAAAKTKGTDEEDAAYPF